MTVIQEQKGLTPDEWVAIACLAREASNYRSQAEPGRKPIDFLLRVQGQVSVGKDGTTTSTTKPTAEMVLAWVLAELAGNPSTNGTAALLAESLAADIQLSGRVPEVEEGYVAKAATLLSAATQRKSVPKKGPTSGAFRVGVVDVNQLSQQVAGAVFAHTRAIALEEKGAE